TPAPLNAYHPQSRTQLRYGSTDAKETATHGYKPAGSQGAGRTSRTRPQELSPQESIALNGTDDPTVKPGS
ncbi:hypothetical protein G3I76_36685, partial [Streptomyces sp. SID11233]|nr:hypothetical protein [Streptomyces sp. SID11233]